MKICKIDFPALWDKIRGFDYRSWFKKFKEKNKYLFLAFGIPMILMFIIYVAMDFWPFGDKMVLTLDLNGQYISFFEELRHKVLEGGSFLYTWSRSVGGEFMGIFAYYLSSPFSFLVCLFPKKYMIEAITVIILLKIGTMGATMSYYLNKSRPTKPLNTIIFSTCYALCSYAVVQAHNLMWLDNLILLPLVTLGIERLIESGKFKLFVFSLAMALITSFYIGYMMCIYVALYFFYYYIAHNGGYKGSLLKENNHFWKSLLRIGVYSAIAIAIAMIIVYPTYTSLQFGKSTFSDPKYTFEQRFDVLDFIAQLFPGSYDTVRPEGLPFVYGGTLALILVPLYFLTSRIRWQERVMSGVFIVVFFVSFNVNALDIVWHGFQKPNWLNYRYSFMLIFLMLVMAYKAFSHIRFANYKHIIFISGILAVVLAVLQKKGLEWVTNFRTIGLSLLLVAIFCVALYFVHSNRLKGQATALIAILVCAEMFTTALINVQDLHGDVGLLKHDSYVGHLEKVQPMVDLIQDYDDSLFYRMEKNFHRKTNDAMAFGYYGISNSTSTLNKPVINTLHRYGYASKSHWTEYRGGTPVADALLGIKYVMSEGQVANGVWEDLSDALGYEVTNNYYIYENPYALSLAYAADKMAAELDVTNYESPFELMNALVGALVGDADGIEIFNEIPIKSDKYNNIDTGFTTNHPTYKKLDTSKAASLQFTVSVKAGEPVYMYIPTDYPREVKLSVSAKGAGAKIDTTYFANKTDHVMFLGTYDKDQDVTVTLKIDKEATFYIRTNQSSYFFSLNADLFKTTFDSLKEGNMEITHFEDDYIEGNVSIPEGKELLYTSVVFDEGWIITVDGEEKELIKTNDCFIAVEVDAGDHEITMRYRPKCYTVGSAVSILGLVAFAGAICLDESKKRRAAKASAAVSSVH
ncbi:MAG: YfhO family protein [Clostridia bacterium]|nr:YfhO family protein [Clostridia bacterium]